MNDDTTTQTPQPGGTGRSAGYVRHEPDARLRAWWDGLPAGTQRVLSGLRPGDAMSAEAAAAVEAIGLVCPAATFREPTGTVRRHIAPRSLVHTVQLVRMNHSERRLV